MIPKFQGFKGLELLYKRGLFSELLLLFLWQSDSSGGLGACSLPDPGSEAESANMRFESRIDGAVGHTYNIPYAF